MNKDLRVLDENEIDTVSGGTLSLGGEVIGPIVWNCLVFGDPIGEPAQIGHL